MKPIRIFTPVFGKKHISWLNLALGRSLNWPDNRQALEGARWTLFIHKTEFAEVMTVATKYFSESQIDTIESDLNLGVLIRERGVRMCEAFVQTIKKCLIENSQMLISTPDFIWSDGSIANMKALSKQRNSCISVPHPRVTPEILNALSGLEAAGLPGPSSDRLVSYARKHAHASWQMSEFGKHHGTFKGGILWRPGANNTQTLQHRMPSPYLCNFVPEDIQYFAKKDADGEPQAWGAIDHTWAQALCEQNRWRMILSSDIAFMCELTEAGDNVPPQESLNFNHPDDFWTQERPDHLLHHKFNRQFIATFRGETT